MYFMTYPIPGPVPLYNNPPMQPQYYQPSRFVISALSIGVTTTVTTSVDHNYVVGQQVRLLIPPAAQSIQLNETSSIVISIPATNQVVLNLNSTGANTFVAVSSGTKPQILAIGDVNSGQINSSGPMSETIYVPGSFINISPL